MHDSDALRCVYCNAIISADDDAQRVEHKKFAHTACAFAANDAFFFFCDQAQHEAEMSREDDF